MLHFELGDLPHIRRMEWLPLELSDTVSPLLMGCPSIFPLAEILNTASAAHDLGQSLQLTSRHLDLQYNQSVEWLLYVDRKPIRSPLLIIGDRRP